jgi:hypothetical protein
MGVHLFCFDSEEIMLKGDIYFVGGKVMLLRR